MMSDRTVWRMVLIGFALAILITVIEKIVELFH